MIDTTTPRRFFPLVASFFLLYLFVFIPCSAFSIGSEAHSKQASGPVVVRAVVDHDVVSPGQTFRLGVLFEMEKPWHIYWKNPGDAGLPTKVDFLLPEEFSTSELMWPIPTSFSQAGGIAGYGYEDSAFFWQSVTLSKDSALSGTVEIPVSIRWLRCSDSLCVPGRSKQKLSVGVGTAQESASKSIFDEWAEQYPLAEKEFAQFGSVSIQSGKTDASPWKLAVNWQTEVKRTRWYLLADDAYQLDPEPKGGTWKTIDGGSSHFSLGVKKLEGVEPKSNVVEAVLVVETSTGDVRALSMNLTDNL